MPNSSRNILKYILIVVVVLALYLLLFSMPYISNSVNSIFGCGQASKVVKNIKMPESVKVFKIKYNECNNFIEGYSDKMVVIYKLESNDLQTLSTIDKLIEIHNNDKVAIYKNYGDSFSQQNYDKYYGEGVFNADNSDTKLPKPGETNFVQISINAH